MRTPHVLQPILALLLSVGLGSVSTVHAAPSTTGPVASDHAPDTKTGNAAGTVRSVAGANVQATSPGNEGRILFILASSKGASPCMSTSATAAGSRPSATARRGIVKLKLGNGRHLVAGKRITGFPEEYEDQGASYFKQFPFLIGQTVESRGGSFQAGGRDDPYIEVDGAVVTGQNYASATPVAQALVAILRQRAAAPSTRGAK